MFSLANIRADRLLGVRVDLKDLISGMRQYALRGEQFIRFAPKSNLSLLLKNSQRQGMDTMRLVGLVIMPLEDISRLASELNAAARSLIVRLVAIVFLVGAARLLMLSGMDDEIWSHWIVMDRLCGTAFLAIAAILIFFVWRKVRTMVWSETDQRRLCEWFSDFIVLRQQGGAVLDLALDLREIRMSELRHGTEGQISRERLYLAYLSDWFFRLRRTQVRWPYLVMMIDMVAFLVCLGGLAVIPFMAWVETASGT